MGSSTEVSSANKILKGKVKALKKATKQAKAARKVRPASTKAECLQADLSVKSKHGGRTPAAVARRDAPRDGHSLRDGQGDLTLNIHQAVAKVT